MGAIKGGKWKRIEMNDQWIPLHWKEHLIAEQKVGGVYFVFIEGKNSAEIKAKIIKLRRFCNELRKGKI